MKMEQTTSKIKKICKNPKCRKEVYVWPYKAKSFSFCSNTCKWELNRKVKSPRRTPETKLFKVKCLNTFCNKVLTLKVWQVKKRQKKGEFKYCSEKCYHYVTSEQYALDLEALKQKQQQEQRQHIWFLK